jgi:hypothetical protein
MVRRIERSWASDYWRGEFPRDERAIHITAAVKFCTYRSHKSLGNHGFKGPYFPLLLP